MAGFMLNYNFRVCVICYMDVKENCRQRGLGSLLVRRKENGKKRSVAGAGFLLPVAISVTMHPGPLLIKAGMKPCGFILRGDIKNGGAI